MGKCIYCGADTNLFIGGAPICRECYERRTPEIPPSDEQESPEGSYAE